MRAKEILEVIKSHKGAMMKVSVKSTVPCLKTVQGVTVEKVSQLYVTAGTEFANRKDVREAIALGERGEVQSLPWGEWSEYPFIIAHKGQEYVRLYPPTMAQLEAFNLAPSVQWFANGAPISRELAETYCGAKAKPSEVKSECFAVNVANLTIG